MDKGVDQTWIHVTNAHYSTLFYLKGPQLWIDFIAVEHFPDCWLSDTLDGISYKHFQF